MTAKQRTSWLVIVVIVILAVIVGALAGNDDATEVGTRPSPGARTTTATSTTTDPVTTLETDDPQRTETTSDPGDRERPDATDLAPTIPAPTPTTGASTNGIVAATRGVLARIPVKGRAPRTGYDRAQFGPAWTDNVAVAGGHNGCDTRNDILRRDLHGITVKPGTRDCVILTGALDDPYTGIRIDFVRGRRTSSAVQIDHVVALHDAWQKGAQQIGVERRRELANDPLNLLAVDGPTNQRKGAGDAATWLPPNKGFRCRYVVLQTWVKARYDLWTTRAEHDTIERILTGCTDAQVGTIG